MGASGRDVDAGAAERRLAEALRAQAVFGAAPPAAVPLASGSGAHHARPRSAGPTGPTGATGTPGPAAAPAADLPPHRAAIGVPHGSTAGPRRSTPPPDATRLRRALLVGFLAGVLLGCLLALLSVLDPGLLPALG